MSLNKFVFVLILLVGFGSSALADNLKIPASLVVHEKDMTVWLHDFAAHITEPNTVISHEIAVEKPYKSTIKEVSFQGGFKLNWTKKQNSNVWAFEGETENITLYAKDLEVHDSFQKQTGGGTITIRIDASCQNLSIAFPGGTKFTGEMAVSWKDNKLTPVLQNFALHPGKVPALKIGACQGPTGLEQFLNEQMAALYKTPEKIAPMAGAELQRFMNMKAEELQNSLMRTFKFKYALVEGEFTGQKFQNLPTGTWVIDGPMTLASKRGSADESLQQDYGLSTMNDAGASGVTVSKKAVPMLLGFLRRAGLLNANFTSKDVPGFDKFRESQFEQGIVWPDLLNFKTSTVFPIAYKTASDPVLSNMANHYPSVDLDIAANADFVMSAPIQGHGTLPYTEFMSSKPATGKITLKPENGVLKVTSQLTSLPLKYAFRKEYSKFRQPEGDIKMLIITAAMMKSPASQTWKFAVPSDFAPVPGYSMGFQGVVYGTKTFRLDMSFKKQQH